MDKVLDHLPLNVIQWYKYDMCKCDNQQTQVYLTGFFLCRFPQLFPPLKPEVVAQRTVDAVRTNTAFVYLPWTMHGLVILKRYSLIRKLFQQICFGNPHSLHLITLFYPSNSMLPQSALEEIHKFSGSYTCMNTFKGRT